MDYRDVIYGSIKLTDIERIVINNPYFQRLRYISQLSSVSLVYPGATNTRFVHSIGACHVAGLYCTHLKLDEEYTQIIRLAALLHDIAHGPFSHLFEKAVEYNHDEYRFILLPKIVDAKYIEPITNIWKDIDKVGSMIVQGPVGSDRIDFTLRDAHYTGMEHFGTIAYDRIINNSLLLETSFLRENLETSFQKKTKSLTIGYKKKVQDDIAQMLQARKYMYKHVYFHTKVQQAELLLIEPIREFMKNKNIDIDFLDLTDMMILSYDHKNIRRYKLRSIPYAEINLVIDDKKLEKNEIIYV